jgi:hypothetical protein
METVVAAEVIFISPVFLAFNATKARQASPVLLLPPIASNLLLIRKKLKTVALAMTTAIARVTLVVVGTAVV